MEDLLNFFILFFPSIFLSTINKYFIVDFTNTISLILNRKIKDKLPIADVKENSLIIREGKSYWSFHVVLVGKTKKKRKTEEKV